MCDLSKLRELAEAGQDVTLDPATFLELLAGREVITIKVEKKKRGPRDPRPYSKEDEEYARWMFERLQERQPDVAPPNFAAWADHVRLMRERDGRTHKQIGGLFRWAQGNSFWCRNIRSPEKLRKQWDRLVDERMAEGEPKASAAQGQKFNFAGADRSSDQAAQSALMKRRGIEPPAEDVPL
jgi:hypothetical protein